MFFIVGSSQYNFKNVNEIKNNLEKIKSSVKINKFEILAKICVDYYNLDSLGILVKNGDMVLEIEKLINDRYKLSSNQSFKDIEGNITIYYSEVYYRTQPDDTDNQNNVDSLVQYLVEGSTKTLFFKTINQFENNKLIKSSSYFNYDLFGIPIGIALVGITNYHYDNNGFLKSEATYSSNFFSSELEISDSMFYTNNAKGLPVETLIYSVDSPGSINLNAKEVMYYDNNDMQIKKERFTNPDNWTIETRFTTDYKTKLTLFLVENTEDGGTTWIPLTRDSIYYDKSLPFNYPNRSVSQNYEEDKWMTTSMEIAKECDISFIPEVHSDLDFTAIIDNSILMIFTKEKLINTTLRLFNINGKLIYDNFFDILPEAVELNKINSGMYFLELSNRNAKGIKKLVTF